jgi:hypothetical protein
MILFKPLYLLSDPYCVKNIPAMYGLYNRLAWQDKR